MISRVHHLEDSVLAALYDSYRSAKRVYEIEVTYRTER